MGERRKNDADGGVSLEMKHKANCVLLHLTELLFCCESEVKNLQLLFQYHGVYFSEKKSTCFI